MFTNGNFIICVYLFSEHEYNYIFATCQAWGLGRWAKHGSYPLAAQSLSEMNYR